MIGKIIALVVFSLVLIAFTGVNATQYYQDFVLIRNVAQPVADNVVEKVLTDTSHYDLKSKSTQLTGGKLP